MKSRDKQVYNNVYNILNLIPGLKSDGIGISMNDGVLTLGGVVSKYSEKVAITNAIKIVVGIRGIVDEIKVEPRPEYQRTDIEIARAAVNALKWDNSVPGKRIRVIVEDGSVTLSGDVQWQFQKKDAESCVRNLIGVKCILNEIQIAPSISAVKVKTKLINEFIRNALKDAEGIEVKVEGSVLTLKGCMSNWYEMQEIVNAAWSMPGVSHVNNLLTINPNTTNFREV